MAEQAIYRNLRYIAIAIDFAIRKVRHATDVTSAQISW